MYFVLVGSHNQLYTFHTLVNLLVTILFYIHARHRVIEAARRDNVVLQSVPWSVGRSLSDKTSVSRGNPNQPIRRNQKHRSVFLDIPSHAENCKASDCWRSHFGLATNVRRIFLNLLQASWRLRESKDEENSVTKYYLKTFSWSRKQTATRHPFYIWNWK